METNAVVTSVSAETESVLTDIHSRRASRLAKWAHSRTGRLLMILVLTTCFFFIEIVVGYVTNSLALVADSFHMLSDIVSLSIGLYAIRMAKREAGGQHTFGFVRAEVLGALINAVFLLALVFSIFVESINRFFEVEEIKKTVLLLWVGGAGLFINLVGLLFFASGHGGHGHSHGGHAHKDHAHAEHKHDACKEEEQDHGHDHEGHAHSHEGHAREGHAHQEHGHKGHAHSHKDHAHAKHKHDACKEEEREHAHSHEDHAHAEHKHDACKEEEQDHGHDHSHEGHAHDEHGHDACKDKARDHGHEHEGHAHSHADKTDSHERKGRKNKMAGDNMHGVFLHILGDALGSVVVIIGALVVHLTDWSGRFYVDPALSILISLILAKSALPLVKSTAQVLLQSAPVSVDVDGIRSAIIETPGVIDCHELHVWSLSGDKIVASVHVTSSNDTGHMSLGLMLKELFHSFGIHSVTIQQETPPQGSVVSDGTACLLPCVTEICNENSCCPLPKDRLNAVTFALTAPTSPSQEGAKFISLV